MVDAGPEPTYGKKNESTSHGVKKQNLLLLTENEKEPRCT